MAKQRTDEYSPEEIARRRDEVIRRMANTPPQPRAKTPAHPPRKGNKAGESRADGKSRAGRER